MSRKIGLGDTHFDPDIDGDVDFDFFGGESDRAGQECDLIPTDDERQNQCITNTTVLSPLVNNEIGVNISIELQQEKQIQIINAGASSAIGRSTAHFVNIIDSSEKPVSSSAVDTTKSSVMVPEAEKWIQQKIIPPEEAAKEKNDDANRITFSQENNADQISSEKAVDAEATTSTVDYPVYDYEDHMSDASASSAVVMVGQTTHIDMKLLSRAVSDLRIRDKQQPRYDRRTTAGSRSGESGSLERPLIVARPRKNMTFSNDEVRRIDNENKLLLKKIIQAQKPSRTSVAKQAPVPPLIASSAINRMKDFKKIENENMMFLKRLQSVKPTKTLSRDYLVGGGSRTSKRSSEFDTRSRCYSLISNSRRRTRASSSSSLPSWTGTGSGSIDSSNPSSKASSSSIKLPKLITEQTLVNIGSD